MTSCVYLTSLAVYTFSHNLFMANTMFTTVNTTVQYYTAILLISHERIQLFI